jgi:hypothetical protein
VVLFQVFKSVAMLCTLSESRPRLLNSLGGQAIVRRDLLTNLNLDHSFAQLRQEYI